MTSRGTGPAEAQTVDAPESDHPAEKEGATLIGTTARGAPWYYDEDANELLEKVPDMPESWSRREDVGTEEVREKVEELEEGWESITSEARDILGLEASEGESDSEVEPESDSSE